MSLGKEITNYNNWAGNSLSLLQHGSGKPPNLSEWLSTIKHKRAPALLRYRVVDATLTLAEIKFTRFSCEARKQS